MSETRYAWVDDEGAMHMHIDLPAAEEGPEPEQIELDIRATGGFGLWSLTRETRSLPGGTIDIRYMGNSEAVAGYHIILTQIKSSVQPPDPELKPCPHCGGEWRIATGNASALHSARCGGCDHRTKWHRTIYDLAADVNRRPQ